MTVRVHWWRRPLGGTAAPYRSCSTVGPRSKHIDSADIEKVTCDLCRLDLRGTGQLR